MAYIACSFNKILTSKLLWGHYLTILASFFLSFFLFFLALKDIGNPD